MKGPSSCVSLPKRKEVQVTTLTTHSVEIGVAKTSDTNDDVDTIIYYRVGIILQGGDNTTG